MSAVMSSVRCRRFGMLLRRELWEHRGSLVWAPLIVAGIEALLMLFGVLLAGFKIGEEGRGKLDLITISGDVTFAMLLDPANYTPELLRDMVAGMNQNLIITPMPVFVTLAFAVFFYCLGALYDDRRDRSVLFWSSLPVREVETVLSKVLTATLIAPTIAMLAAIGVIAVSLLTQAILIAQLGGEPLPLLWLTSNPFRIVLAQLVALPVYALWALPAVGWLLMCSAFARSKPFLWAVTVPVLIGLFASGVKLFGILDFNLWGAWRELVLRPFAHLFPPVLTWLDLPADLPWDHALIDPGYLWRNLAQVRVWIGAGIGAAMIAAAVAIRRWREEV